MTMKFDQVTAYFEQIEQVSSRLEMTRLLAILLSEATPEEASILCNISLGQLHPPYRGTQFNLALKSIIQAVAQVQQKSVSVVAQELKKVGDIGLVIASAGTITSDTATSGPTVSDADTVTLDSIAADSKSSAQSVKPSAQNMSFISTPVISPVISPTASTVNTVLSSSKNLELQDVYDALCTLEQRAGTGSQEQKIEQLVILMQQLRPLSSKYLIRIILGTLRLGFSDMTLIDALSVMVAGDKSLSKRIEHAYNLCADIGYIARLLKESGIKGLDIERLGLEKLDREKLDREKLGAKELAITALERMQIQVGIPIRPASAERLPTAQAIIEKIGPAIAQPKLDGFRVQIHIDKRSGDLDKSPSPDNFDGQNGLYGQKVFFFSRHLHDISYMFPDLIPTLLSLPVATFIAEGEAICFDQNTDTFLPFQETVKRKRKHGIEQAALDFPIKLFIFDILYLDGQSQLPKTHTERRQTLLNVFDSKNKLDNNLVQVIDEVAVATGNELESYFLSMIELGLEGIIVKRPDAVYQPGKRNFNWIKLKRQEEGHLEDTLDAVVLGYYAGAGKRAHFGIGSFLVGLYNPTQDRFETVAKIGTGLKDAEWKELKEKCDSRKVEGQPKNVWCDKNLAPDTWVYPEIVCQVRADEITLSPVHTAGKDAEHLGYALRFPRIMAFRVDKSALEATTIDEIKQLYKNQYGRNK